MTEILDLFAGHGVGVACYQLGIEEHAVEIAADVIATREANGLRTTYNDAWDIDRARDLTFDGLWASPPCQTFSVTGTGTGRQDLDRVLSLLDTGAHQSMRDLRFAADSLGDPRTGLVLSPFTYAYTFRPRFVILEQVTPVLPIWERGAVELQQLGYSTWTGVIDAADYGVPQNRRRAYLIARQDTDATPPAIEPSRTMFDAVQWGFTHRPAPTITGHVAATRSPSGTQAVYRNAIERGQFVLRPGHSTAPSNVAKSGLGSEYPPDAVNLTKRDALVLQSYPEDFKLVGSKASWQLQVGNSVPPRVARKILETML